MTVNPTDPAVVADVLERAANRLSKPGAWTQGHNARNAEGHVTVPSSEAAICWCMGGAILAESGGSKARAAFDIIRKVLPPQPSAHDPIAAFNDAPERTQQEVVQVLREAATLLQETNHGD